MNKPDKYIVEIRESLRGGDDYAERHESCYTPDEVRETIKNKHEDEYLYQVHLYKDGSDRDPIDVTNKFLPKRATLIRRFR